MKTTRLVRLAILDLIDPADLLASGGNSSLILLHSLDTLAPDPVDCLIGHALNVCTLAYSSAQKKLVSGSWDHTARVWSGYEGKWSCELVLEGHDEAVWSVAVVEGGVREGSFLTGEVSLTYLMLTFEPL